MRYSLTKEVTKDNDKKLIQHCVYDSFEGKVIARFMNKEDAQKVIDRYKATSLDLED